MKKKIIILIVLVSVAFPYLFFGLRGCGGSHYMTKIYAQDLFEENKTEISYFCKGYSGPGSSEFTAQNLDDIEDAIKNQAKGIYLHRFQNSILLKDENAAGTDYLLILQIGESEKKKRYIFFGLDLMAQEERFCFSFLFPFHLLDSQSINSVCEVYPFRMERNHNYLMMDATPQDFLAFYKESKKYIIIEKENEFVLTGYSFNYPSTVKENLKFSAQLVFHFTQLEDQWYVSIDTLPLAD